MKFRELMRAIGKEKMEKSKSIKSYEGGIDKKNDIMVYTLTFAFDMFHYEKVNFARFMSIHLSGTVFFCSFVIPNLTDSM